MRSSPTDHEYNAVLQRPPLRRGAGRRARRRGRVPFPSPIGRRGRRAPSSAAVDAADAARRRSATSPARRRSSFRSIGSSRRWPSGGSTRSSTAPTRRGCCRSTSTALGAAYYTGNCTSGSARRRARRSCTCAAIGSRASARYDLATAPIRRSARPLAVPARVRLAGHPRPDGLARRSRRRSRSSAGCQGGWPGVMARTHALASRPGTRLTTVMGDGGAATPDAMLGSMAAALMPEAGLSAARRWPTNPRRSTPTRFRPCCSTDTGSSCRSSAGRSRPPSRRSRSGGSCGFRPPLYNDADDIARLVGALSDAGRVGADLEAAAGSSAAATRAAAAEPAATAAPRRRGRVADRRRGPTSSRRSSGSPSSRTGPAASRRCPNRPIRRFRTRPACRRRRRGPLAWTSSRLRSRTSSISLLEPERRSPHDRLVGRLEPVEAGLRRRPGPSIGPGPSSSGVSGDRPRASPGSSPRASYAGIHPARRSAMTTPPRSSAAAMSSETGARQVDADESTNATPSDDRDHAHRQPPA